MRRLLLPFLVAAGLLACAPTMRQILTDKTIQYTKCGHVEVACQDDACSNVAGGPWRAQACGTQYRCTDTGGNVVCAPETTAQ
jgi:hypothetical protein